MDEISGEITAAFGDFRRLQTELFNVRRSPNIEETLDQLEVLLDMVIEFEYAQVYLRDRSGRFVLERGVAPQGLTPEWAYIQWAIENQEATVIPDETGESGYSMLMLPLVGNVQVIGVFALWVQQDSAEFTQGQFMLLNLIANEAASAVEAHFFREKLEESQERMVDLVESVPLGIIAIGANRKVWMLNGTMEVLLNIRRDDVVGREYEMVLPQEAARSLTQLIDRPEEGEKELHLEIAGEEAVFGLTINPMKGGRSGETVGYVAVCRDLMLSREVSKLREVDAMKNDFLSLVSHELRTPLTSILAYTEALMMEGMVESDAERREYLGIIYSEGERLTRLINDVLDLTKMEAGKMEYLFSGNDINDIIMTSVTNSSAAAEKKRHKIVLDVAKKLPEVRCDSDRILQVMMNLLSNAIKFTPAGGQIRICSRLQESEGERTPPVVYVEVADNGIGIAPENLNRVFARFEQIESVEHHTDGTGLGMSICKMIIEQGHAGKIDLRSKLGEGTTFFFTLPVI